MKFKTSKKPINNAAPFSFPHPPAQHHLQLLMALKRGGSILNPAGSESGRDVSYVKRAEERGCVNWQSTDTGSSDRMRSVAVVVCTQQNTVVSNSECCLLSLMLSGWKILLICPTIKYIDWFGKDLILWIEGALLVQFLLNSVILSVLWEGMSWWADTELNFGQCIIYCPK